MTKNSCTLRWNPPKDDGGCEITHYVVEKMDADTARWVPVADSAGTSMRLMNKIQFSKIQTIIYKFIENENFTNVLLLFL